MRRATQAKADGLTDYDVGTYPPHPSEVDIKKGAGLKGLMTMGLMGASLLGGGVVGGAYLANFLKANKTVETITNTVDKEVIDYDVDMSVIPPE